MTHTNKSNGIRQECQYCENKLTEYDILHRRNFCSAECLQKWHQAPRYNKHRTLSKKSLAERRAKILHDSCHAKPHRFSSKIEAERYMFDNNLLETHEVWKCIFEHWHISNKPW